MKRLCILLIVFGLLTLLLVSSGCSSASLNGSPVGSYQGYRTERAHTLILYQDGEFEEYIWGSGQRSGTWSFHITNKSRILLKLKNSQNYECYLIEENYLIGIAGYKYSTENSLGWYDYKPFTYNGEEIYLIDAPTQKYEKVSSSTNLKRDMQNQFQT